MNPERFRASLRHLGLNQIEAARLFGYDERTVRRWMQGKWPVPRIIQIVLWLMTKFKVKPEDVPHA